MAALTMLVKTVEIIVAIVTIAAESSQAHACFPMLSVSDLEKGPSKRAVYMYRDCICEQWCVVDDDSRVAILH